MNNKDNSGNLFKNTFKEEGSKQPDYKGNVMVNGVVMSVSGWVNKDKNGNPYFGLSFQSMQEAAKYTKETSSATSKPEFQKSTNTNDMPF